MFISAFLLIVASCSDENASSHIEGKWTIARIEGQAKTDSSRGAKFMKLLELIVDEGRDQLEFRNDSTVRFIKANGDIPDSARYYIDGATNQLIIMDGTRFVFPLHLNDELMILEGIQGRKLTLTKTTKQY